jgi:uncharacterized membrane protein
MAQTIANLVIAIYAGEEGAENALKQLKANKEEAYQSLQAAIAVRKDHNSGLHYQEVGLTPEKGALGGVILGGVLGILSGGIGIVLGGLGALVGGLVGEKKREGRLSSAEINQVITTIAPGSSALVLMVGPEQRDALSHALVSGGAEVITADIPAELADKLEAHRAEAYAHWREQIGE